MNGFSRILLPKCPNGCVSPFYLTTVIRHCCPQKDIDNYWCIACNWEKSVADYLNKDKMPENTDLLAHGQQRLFDSVPNDF
jgi:hypothetical protein